MDVLPVDRGICYELEQRERVNPGLDNRLPIPLRPITNEQKAVEDSARYLATPAVETLSRDLLYSPINDDRQLLEQAGAVREQLDTELARQASAIQDTIPRGSDERWTRLRLALQESAQGRWTMLEQCGLQVNPGWLSDIVRSMLRNRPVEVEIVQTRRPYIDRTPDGHYGMVYDDILAGQSAALGFAAMLRRIQGFDYTRPVAMVDDLLFSSEHFAVSSTHQGHTLQAAHLSLQEAGAIGANDQPGKDFVFVPQTRSITRVSELVEKLQQSETGMLVPQGDGTLFWRPGDRIYNSTARQHAAVTDILLQQGVLLRTEDGTPTSTARNAAGYLNPINTAFTHVRLHDTRLTPSPIGRKSEIPTDHQALSILLQSLGITHPDRDHSIYYDHRQMPAARTVFALTALLRNEVDRVVTSLEELDDVRQVMIPKDYFEHNYDPEDGTWQVDMQGVQAIGNELPLHYSPGKIASAAIIGYGPFSYPGLAIAPFMQKGARIDISDLLPQNINFAQEWFQNQAEPSHEAVYGQFGGLFRQLSVAGYFYQKCEERLRTAGRLQVAALETLPSDSAQVVAESFVSCSNNIEKYGFYESIRQKARILTWTPDSMMIAVHMVGSKGWNNSGDDEGITIPAANLSLDDIKAGYMSAGLRIVKCVPLHSDSGFREDYEGMVVIFAKPDSIQRPRLIAA